MAVNDLQEMQRRLQTPTMRDNIPQGGQPAMGIQQPMMQQQAPMVDVGTALSQVKASNKVVAERVKATNGSLTNKHFGSIKRWHKATLQIIETENEAGTLQQAIGIQNSLSALNERAKRLRADYADIVLNDEISNYAYSYFNFFISEYLSSL